MSRSNWRCLPASWCLSAVLALLLLVGGPVQADRIDPFTVVVPVADQSTAERRVASRIGLRRVLLRLTGREQLVDEAMRGRTRLPQEQQIRYLELPPARDGEAARPALELVFDDEAVMNLVRELELPIWPLERIGPIVWVAIDNGIERQLLGEAIDHEPIQRALREAADERGLPLIIPLMDLQDRQQVRFSDVWAGFVDQVARASERYQAPALLIGRAARTGNGWMARWHLVEGPRGERWESQTPDLESALAEAAAGAAERLGQRYAVSPSMAEERLVIRVFGVQSAAEYARVKSYLEQLSVVDSVDPVRVSPGVIELAMVTPAGLEAVSQALALERVLERIEPADRRISTAELQYRLPR